MASVPSTTATPAHAGRAPADRRTLESRLRAMGQGHVFNFLDRLDAAQIATLWSHLESIDLGQLDHLIHAYVKNKPRADVAGTIEPAACYSPTRGPGGQPWDCAAYHAKGVELVRAGKVAAFTVAGGQGSRLGYDGPKGCYAGGSVTRKPLFACLADWILAAQERWCRGTTIPWYIMTSPGNHAATVAFFRENRFFGLAERDVMFFPQGVMPAFEVGSGRLLMADRHELALSPDGHGGSLRALFTSGATADMKSRGIEHISYTQIDNPLVRVIDPLFLGLHAFAPNSSGEMSSKMVAKAHAGEKVGVLCRVNGKTSVIEYSDMPESLSSATNPDGSLRFNAGSIAIHTIGVAFVEKLNSGGGFSLPYHRADKKVGCIDTTTGTKIEPGTPNAVKLETFVFDALPLCRSSIVLETDRVEEFAPIKNATGADSVETCTQIQTQRAARWLRAAGHEVPLNAQGQPDCVLELSPRVALAPDDLRTLRIPAITRGTSVDVRPA